VHPRKRTEHSRDHHLQDGDRVSGRDPGNNKRRRGRHRESAQSAGLPAIPEDAAPEVHIRSDAQVVALRDAQVKAVPRLLAELHRQSLTFILKEISFLKLVNQKLVFISFKKFFLSFWTGSFHFWLWELYYFYTNICPICTVLGDRYQLQER